MKITAPAFDGTQPCAQVDPELFFPEGATTAHVYAKKIITPICNSCEFQEPCLEYALHSDVSGLWAGTTENDRKKIRQRTGIKVDTYMYLTVDRLTR